MPGADLMELLTRLHGEAVKVLVESGSEAQSSREDAETDRRLQLGYEACNRLLAGLDHWRREALRQCESFDPGGNVLLMSGGLRVGTAQ